MISRKKPLPRSTKPIARHKRPRGKIDPRDAETRKILHDRAHGRCEKCGNAAPLHGDGQYPAGEWAHKERRWKGDKWNPERAWWSCGGIDGCHRREHRAEEHDLCPPKPRG